jgi:hypothetical protein
VAGAGGACANITVGINASAQPAAIVNFTVITRKRRNGADVPGMVPKSGNRFSDQIMPE